MRILVALRWVALRPEVDPLTGSTAVDPRFSGASPADRSALEWALRLAGQTEAGSVTAATVGPPEADAMLRDALAAGADRAVLVTGVATDAPSRRIGRELAELARPCDLVLCGNASLDRGSGAVPAFIAHELGWAQALGLVTLQLDGNGGLVAERRLDGGRRERLSVTGPGVLSFEAGPELRRAPLASALAAKTALIDTRPAVAGDPARVATVVARRAFRPRPRAAVAPRGSTLDRLATLLGTTQPPGTASIHEVSPAEAARLTVERLRTWGYLEPPASTVGEPSGDC